MNNSINFQKFQRYIHSEITFNEYIDFIEKIEEAEVIIFYFMEAMLKFLTLDQKI